MPTDDLTPDERLRLQNELTKAQLEEQHGAVFGFGEDLDGAFTPEMEAQFLQQIQAFESQDATRYVPIRSLVSAKVFRQAADLAAAEDFEGANALLLEAYLGAGVLTDQPEWLTAEGFYHFLSEDFAEHTIPPPAQADPSGEQHGQRQMIGVMYDQVREDSPDHMAAVTEQFLEDLLTPDRPFEGTWLAHTCREGANVVDKATATQTIRAWKQQWRKIVPLSLGFGGPMRGPDGAVYFQFGCAYAVTGADGAEQEFSGPGICQLAIEGKAFRVVGFAMEGFEM